MRKGFSLLILLVFSTSFLFAQHSFVKGRVVDKKSSDPISYVNIQIKGVTDTSFITGTITNDDGSFRIDKLMKGEYSLKFSFIGYKPYQIDKLIVKSGSTDIGTVELEVAPENINEISINSEKPTISYKVDRKVINADGFPGADVAIDLLENVPSVQVDFNGNLTYRGDGLFKVYINGRPVANGEEKLRQIPANQVDKIEIVTNPSARFDAEGTAGIIHVIMKKNKLEGYAISSALKAGTRGNLEWTFSVDKKGKKGGWYVNGNIGNYIWGESNISQLQKIENDSGRYENSFQKVRSYGGFSQYLEVGFNYDLSEKDNIDFSGHINPFKQTEFQYSDGYYSEVEYTADGHFGPSEYYKNTSRDNLFYQYAGGALTYEHAFNKKRSHLLRAYVNYSVYLRDMEETMIDTKDYTSYEERVGFKQREKQEKTLEGELSYAVPFSKTVNMELGGKATTDNIPEITSVSGTFDENDNITPFPGQPLNQEVNFIQDIFAGFLTLKGEWEKIALQIGGRVEYTDRTTDYTYQDTLGNEVFVPGKTQFTDFFPSFHFTYSKTEDHQFTVSYSRRIDRPRYMQLIPIKRYYSPFGYSVGNGNLLPSYSNSFEVGYKKSWDRDFLGFEVFGRTTEKVKQSFTRTDTLNLLYYIPENVGNSLSIGAELMTGVDIFSWWNLNFSASMFYYQLDVEVDNDAYTENTFRVNTRINNSFSLPMDFTLKWDLRYNSPRFTAQTQFDGYFYSDVSMKKGFKNNQWAVSLVFSNLFTGIQYYGVTSDTGFSVETTTISEPYATVKVAYLMNNQK